MRTADMGMVNEGMIYLGTADMGTWHGGRGDAGIVDMGPEDEGMGICIVDVARAVFLIVGMVFMEFATFAASLTAALLTFVTALVLACEVGFFGCYDL